MTEPKEIENPLFYQTGDLYQSIKNSLPAEARDKIGDVVHSASKYLANSSFPEEWNKLLTNTLELIPTLDNPMSPISEVKLAALERTTAELVNKEIAVKLDNANPPDQP